VNDVKLTLKIPPADDSEDAADIEDVTEDVVDNTELLQNPQKVTILVDDESWRTLKVHCARNKIKITEQAGKIIKKWVATNVAD